MNAFARKCFAISPLPAPLAALPFDLANGQVVMFRGADWASERLDLSTQAWRAGVRHNLKLHSCDPRAAWVAYNLPRGQVMTLTRYHRDLAPGQRLSDLRDVAQVVDLIGTGITEAVDLAQLDLRDAVSSMFWRPVDVGAGAIELYSETGFKGNRTVIFLAEWQQAKLHRLADWVIEDRLGSVRWRALCDKQYCDLYQHADALGGKYPRMTGWFTGGQEASDVSKWSLNDMVSALRWGTLASQADLIGAFSSNLSLGA